MHPSLHAHKTPDKAAYIMAGSRETVTYKELDARSNQGAHLFRALGLTRGDCIVIFMENNARYFEICWAAQRSGLYFAAISSRLTAPEAAYIIKDSDAKVLITSHAMIPVARELVPLIDHIGKRLMVGGTEQGYDNWQQAIAQWPTEPIADQSSGLAMLYSSGTTGRPKGIRIPLDDEPIDSPSTLTQLVAALYGFNEKTIYLSPAPLYHAAPLYYNLAVQRLGGTCIIMEHFDPEGALQLIEQYKVTASQWVPTMFIRMLKLPAQVRDKYDLSSLKAAIHAAAPCPIPIKRQMIDWWGPVIHEYYAGTEGNGFCTIGSEDWLAHPGSVGKAMLGELHILDEKGDEQPPGKPGDIYFADGPEFSYYKDEEKTRECHNKDGWSTLGDIGYMDKEGYLYLTDRKAFMIISGGVNVYPQETENLLATHAKVIDVAVIGVPNEDFGEEVKAIVQPVNWADTGPELEAELIAFCRAHLSPIKCPRSVDFERQLPRHPTGKLYKRELMERYR